MKFTRLHRINVACFLLLASLGAGALIASPALAQRIAPRRPFVVNGTRQAATAIPRVHVQLRQGDRVLTGRPLIPGLDDHADSFIAFLDTGASGYVISKATVERFGIEAEDDAVYVEVGLHGEKALGVSRTYTVALAGGAIGQLGGEPDSEFRVIHREVPLLIRSDENDGLMAMFGDMNIIGMPAIRYMCVEIDPSPMLASRKPTEAGGDNLDQLIESLSLGSAGPKVTLRRYNYDAPDVDVEVRMEMMDFNLRNHPSNRGTLPVLQSNPMIMNVETSRGFNTFKGNWLLDTGAMASIISVKHAQALGLYDANGQPTRSPDFTLPLGDFSGGVQSSPGFVIDRLLLPGRARRSIEYRDVSVVVKDVGTKLNDGSDVILDGVFGMNLLLPSVKVAAGGVPTGSPTQGPCNRFWIDGHRGTLMIDLR